MYKRCVLRHEQSTLDGKINHGTLKAVPLDETGHFMFITVNGKACLFYSVLFFQAHSASIFSLAPISVCNFLNTECQDQRNFHNRQLGGYLGLLAGDMFGMSLEFKNRDEAQHETIKETLGFGAKAGTFSDDTSLALCVADTIAQKGTAATPEDFWVTFKKWAAEGYLSCESMKHSNNVPKDIGKQIRKQLSKKKYSEPVAKNVITNGCLMRNYPVIINNNLDTARTLAHQHSLATHAGAGVLNTSDLLTTICWKLLHEGTENHIAQKELLINTILKFKQKYGPVAKTFSEDGDATIPGYIQPMVMELKKTWKNGNGRKDVYSLRNYPLITPNMPDYKKTDGFCQFGAQGEDTLHHYEDGSGKRHVICSAGGAGCSFVAAVWAILATDNFDDAIKAAANLANDADTVAAITGQMAGIIYGAENITLKDDAGKLWIDIMEPEMKVKVFELYTQLTRGSNETKHPLFSILAIAGALTTICAIGGYLWDKVRPKKTTPTREIHGNEHLVKKDAAADA